MYETNGVDRATITRLHRACVAAIEPTLARFFDRIAPSRLPADGSVASLIAVSAWFLERVADPKPGAATSIPAWWNPDAPTADHAHPSSWPLTRAQLELVDELQAYVAHVVLTAREEARWVIFEGLGRDHRNGETMLRVDDGVPLAARDLVYHFALDAVHFKRPVRITHVHDVVFAWLAAHPA